MKAFCQVSKLNFPTFLCKTGKIAKMQDFLIKIAKTLAFLQKMCYNRCVFERNEGLNIQTW